MPEATCLKETPRLLEAWPRRLLDDYIRQYLALYCDGDESSGMGQLPGQAVAQWRKIEPLLVGNVHCCAFGVTLVEAVEFEFLVDDPEEEARVDLGHQDPEDLPDHLVPGIHELALDGLC